MDNEYVHKELILQVGNKHFVKQSLRTIKSMIGEKFGDDVSVIVTNGSSHLEFLITLEFKKEHYLRLKLVDGIMFNGFFLDDILTHDGNKWMIGHIHAFWTN